MNENVIGSKSKRGHQFIDFSKLVITHIDEYTVPQYGDVPDDMVEEWSAKEVKQQMEKYLKRMGNNGRGEKDDLLCCLKISHYSCILRDKLIKESKGES